jgi:hypothetical protein
MNITAIPAIAASWAADVVDVTNTGSTPIYAGTDNAVSASTGQAIAPGAHVEITSTPVYLVAPSGDSTATVAACITAEEVRDKVSQETGVPTFILPFGSLAQIRAYAAELNAWKAAA